MINTSLIYFIKNKLNILTLTLFIVVMQLSGFIINCFEPYPLFAVLSPTLFIMMFSTILVLKSVLHKLDCLKKYYENITLLKDSFQIFFHPSNIALIIVLFLLIVGIYFLCLYELNYYSINLMGAFILFLGGSTFFLALICYELYIRLTICLKKLENSMKSQDLEYDFNNPKETVWLKDIYKLCQTMRNASLIIGLLFVIENAMILWANVSQNPIISYNVDTIQSLKYIPLELWVIWIFIFISIALAFPLIAVIQTLTLKNIVLHIQNDFNKKIMQHYNEKTNVNSSVQLYVLLKTSNIVEKSLKETYLLKNEERFIAITASLLTCFVHLLTFYETLIREL